MIKEVTVFVTVFFFCITSFCQLPKSDSSHITICSFNVYLLGGVSPKYKEINQQHKDPNYTRSDSSFTIPDRISNCADLLSRGNFDLMVLQEVVDGIRGDSAVRDLCNELIRNSGKDLCWFTSDRIGKGMRMESMAFIYDKAKINLIAHKGSKSSLLSTQEPKNRKFVKTTWKSGDFDFTLFSCHFAWNEKDCKRRQADYVLLSDILNNPDKFSSDPDIIVVGDFNRFGGRYCKKENNEFGIQQLNFDSSKFRVPHVECFDPSISNLKEVAENSGIIYPQQYSTTVSANTMVYDMIWITTDVLEEYNWERNKWNIDFGVLVFDEADGNAYLSGTEDLSSKEIKYLYSDHRPIWMKFKTNTASSDK